MKRRKLHANAVPASSVHVSVVLDSVLHASDFPESAGSSERGEDPVIRISPCRQGALADLGLLKWHGSIAPFIVPHHSHLSLKGPNKGPTQLQLREAVNLQATTSGLFGNLAELSEKIPELKQTSRDMDLSLVLSRAKGAFGKYMPLVSNWEEFALE